MAVPPATIAGRLGIRPGAALWFSPIEWLHVLGPLPPGVRIRNVEWPSHVMARRVGVVMWSTEVSEETGLHGGTEATETHGG